MVPGLKPALRGYIGPARQKWLFACKTGQPEAARFGASKSQVVQAVQDVLFLQVRRVDEPGLRTVGVDTTGGFLPAPSRWFLSSFCLAVNGAENLCASAGG